MLKNLILSFIIFIIIFRLVKSYEALLFSLKYFYNTNSIINNTQISIFNNLYNSYLYSYIKIGNPSFTIKTFFSIDTPHFSLIPNLEIFNNKNLSNYYHINKSTTFQNISSLNKYYVISKNDIEAKEKFIINGYNLENKKISEIILNDFDIVVGVKNNYEEIKKNETEIYYLTIGLKQLESYKDKFNIVYLLKEKNITNNYNWFIYFETNTKKVNELYSYDEFINITCKLIIGDEPHNFLPTEFSESQKLPTKSTNYYWLLYFNNIYYYKNDINNNNEIIKQEIFFHQGIISLNELIIICPIEYHTYIKNDFFIEYISRNICHFYYDSEIQGFYCDKNNNFNINNLKKFPTLYFEHKDLNYTFELTYKDLFIEKNNKYIFLIAILNNDNQNWFLTYIFLKKYQFVFNPDSKTISFYDKKYEEDENKNMKKENNKRIKNILIIILIILSWIIFIVIGIIIGKFLYKKWDKKKRANELDDNYEYISEKNIN